MFMKHYAPNPLHARKVHKFSIPKFTKGNYLKNKIYIFFNFQQVIYSSSSTNWPCLKLLYSYNNFRAPSYNNFRDILMTSFQWSNLQRAMTRKNEITFFKFPPGYLLIIFYQLTNFEATCYNSFIYSLSFISWLSLKLLAVIVFEISWLQVFNAKICKGQ